MTSDQTAITKIIKTRTKKDKNGKEYLVIETEDGHIIFAFPRVIFPERWKELLLGRSYQFVLKGDSGKNTHTLMNFERVWVFEWPPKPSKKDGV